MEQVDGGERARHLRKVGAMLGAMKGSVVDPVAVWVLDGAMETLEGKAKEIEAGGEAHPEPESKRAESVLEDDEDDTHPVRSASHRSAVKRGHR